MIPVLHTGEAQGRGFSIHWDNHNGDGAATESIVVACLDHLAAHQGSGHADLYASLTIEALDRALWFLQARRHAHVGLLDQEL